MFAKRTHSLRIPRCTQLFACYKASTLVRRVFIVYLPNPAKHLLLDSNNSNGVYIRKLADQIEGKFLMIRPPTRSEGDQSETYDSVMAKTKAFVQTIIDNLESRFPDHDGILKLCRMEKLFICSILVPFSGVLKSFTIFMPEKCSKLTPQEFAMYGIEQVQHLCTFYSEMSMSNIDLELEWLEAKFMLLDPKSPERKKNWIEVFHSY